MLKNRILLQGTNEALLGKIAVLANQSFYNYFPRRSVSITRDPDLASFSINYLRRFQDNLANTILSNAIFPDVSLPLL